MLGMTTQGKVARSCSRWPHALAALMTRDDDDDACPTSNYQRRSMMELTERASVHPTRPTEKGLET